tara:strand:+ start:85 stop:369 length:285 start_codon:yes stop_codon:yes gene_type:complete
MDAKNMNKQVDDFYNKLEDVKETLNKLEDINTDDNIENLLRHESALNKNINLLRIHKSGLDPNSNFYKTFDSLSTEYNNARMRFYKTVNKLQRF